MNREPISKSKQPVRKIKAWCVWVHRFKCLLGILQGHGVVYGVTLEGKANIIARKLKVYDSAIDDGIKLNGVPAIEHFKIFVS